MSEHEWSRMLMAGDSPLQIAVVPRWMPSVCLDSSLSLCLRRGASRNEAPAAPKPTAVLRRQRHAYLLASSRRQRKAFCLEQSIERSARLALACAHPSSLPTGVRD